MEHANACGDPVSCYRGGKVAGTDRSHVFQNACPHRPSRTRVLENAAPDTPALKDGKAHVQAGAGVVADSDPTYEFNETVNKSMDLRRAIALAKTIKQ